MIDARWPRPSRTYRCSAWARWLPRALGASLLTASLLISFRIDPDQISAYSRPFKIGLVVFAAAVSLWIVRRGAEVRLEVTPAGEHLEFRYAARSARLAYADLDRLDFSPAFGPSRHWLSAMILIDREGGEWRVPAVLADGANLVEEILDRAARSDLRAWAEVRGLAAKMGSSTRRFAAGYLVAGFVLAAAAGYACT